MNKYCRWSVRHTHSPHSFPSRRTTRITSAPRRRSCSSSTTPASCCSWACAPRRRGPSWCWSTSLAAPCTASSTTPREYYHLPSPMLPPLPILPHHHHCILRPTGRQPPSIHSPPSLPLSPPPLYSFHDNFENKSHLRQRSIPPLSQIVLGI